MPYKNLVMTAFGFVLGISVSSIVLSNGYVDVNTQVTKKEKDLTELSSIDHNRVYVKSHDPYFDGMSRLYRHEKPITLGNPDSYTPLNNLKFFIKNNERQTAQNMTCLALNIYHEARGSTQKDQVGTAQVVMNRLESKHYPDSVCEVVWQYNCKDGNCVAQFTWTKDGKSDIPKETSAWEKAQRLAYLVYTGNIDDPTGGATHYYAHRKVNPSWSNGHEKLVIANHTYLRANN